MSAGQSAFKALADPTRRAILKLLAQKEMSAGDIAAHFPMTKATLSHHLAVLKEAELVTVRREAQTLWYMLHTTVLQEVVAWAMEIAPNAQRARRRKSAARIT
ncbi:MAG: winged helix-turn-helix transcriptional regulator [Betaproteobacteria bacterium]|nr:winged helix-turn-helix transcriptional regulator [Betaproteobacteria bacterium]